MYLKNINYYVMISVALTILCIRINNLLTYRKNIDINFALYIIGDPLNCKSSVFNFVICLCED